MKLYIRIAIFSMILAGFFAVSSHTSFADTATTTTPAEVNLVLSHMGTHAASAGWDATADLNNDGVVSLDDLNISLNTKADITAAMGTTATSTTGWNATADVNNDGIVDLNDLNIENNTTANVLAHLGTHGVSAGWDASADMNNDGVIDLNDLNFVLNNLGSTSTTTATSTASLPTVTITTTGTPVTAINWTSTDATSCSLSSSPATDNWTGTVATSSTVSTSNLPLETTFNVTCTGPGGSAGAGVYIGAGLQGIVATSTPTDTGTSTATTTDSGNQNNGGTTQSTGGTNVSDTSVSSTGGSSYFAPSSTGIVLGTSTVATTGSNSGQVLGESISCPVQINSYIKFGKNNNTTDVINLQKFLNAQLGTSLPLTGFYGTATFNAVEQYQSAHATDILLPWVKAGLMSSTTPTGYVYKTTTWFINNTLCSGLNLPQPLLP